MEIGVDAIANQALLPFEGLQAVQLSRESPLTQTFAQGIPSLDQTGQIQALLPLQTLELSQPQLNAIEMVGIALESSAGGREVSIWTCCSGVS